MHPTVSIVGGAAANAAESLSTEIWFQVMLRDSVLIIASKLVHASRSFQGTVPAPAPAVGCVLHLSGTLPL